jgi:hypothetical protein
MKSLLDVSAFEELRGRLDQLTPETRGRWGKMDVAQMMAHLSNVLEIAVGDQKPARLWLSYLIGSLIKIKFIDNSPIPHNSPTVGSFRVTTPKEFLKEKARLSKLLERLNTGGAAGVTTHPHPFFGPMTPDEWGRGQYKHASYHFDQFGV